MRRSEKLALAGVLGVTLLGAAFMRSRPYALYYGQMPVTKWMIAGAGWVIATYGPVLSAFAFWRFMKHRQRSWMLHLLLLPLVYVMLVAGSRLMLSTLYVPDFDATLGAPIMPAFASIVATATIYSLALIAERMSGSSGQANGD